MENIIRKVLMLPIVLGMLSCASIPKQAPELSEELGIKISSIEKSHLALLHFFFAQKRELVDEFIIKEWTPVFAREFFNNTEINAAWNAIVASGNTEDRLKFIVLLGPKLQGQINKKRLELIKPLDDLERAMENSIREEYDIARGINNSITSFLYSASKVDENRSRYMKMLGVKEEKVDEALNKTDEIVGKLVQIGGTVLEKEKQANEYLEKIKEIKNKLSGNNLAQ